jgi:SWI/SNF-related matrix-associated actin-dependent regulator of chromatin subfamily A3
MSKAGNRIPVSFEHASGTLHSKKDDSRVGIPDGGGLEILRGLTEEQAIDLQLLCTLEPGRQTLGSKINKSKPLSPSAYLSAIVYGPLELFEDVGKFVEEHDMYLQDPHSCDRNVRYRNPHRLSGLDPDAPMTLDLVQPAVGREEVQNPADLLAGLESDEFLPDAEAPSVLRTALYK